MSTKSKQDLLVEALKSYILEITHLSVVQGKKALKSSTSKRGPSNLTVVQGNEDLPELPSGAPHHANFHVDPQDRTVLVKKSNPSETPGIRQHYYWAHPKTGQPHGTFSDKHVRFDSKEDAESHAKHWGYTVEHE